MPGIYRDEGVVLRAIKLGEADRIVTIFTRGNGKIRAVAKGVRKTKSRFGGRLEPFTRVNLMLYRGRDLDTITSAEILTSFEALRTGYAGIARASAVVDAVDKVTPDRERLVSVYELLIAGLDALAARPGPTIVPAFLVKLLSISGYHPQLNTCAGCGSPSTAAFSPILGGVSCEMCAMGDHSSVAIPIERIALLSRLLSHDFGEPADDETAASLTRLLTRYAEHHLERPFKGLRSLAAS
ncbi:MAG TPA: DNA repair protein RecO [Actinomycetota bacterium]|nr:DNA repair protein RecO [Actinomycetota bacterium]